MPNMNGRDLHRAIRGRGADTGCIFMSGYAEVDRLRADELDSAVPMIAKPWTLGELLFQVRAVLDRQAS